MMCYKMCVIESGYAPARVKAESSAYYLHDYPINHYYTPDNHIAKVIITQLLI